MELTFYCVPSCDSVPILGRVTWILVGNLEKVFTFQRGDAILEESQACGRYVGLFTQCEQKPGVGGDCSKKPDAAK